MRIRITFALFVLFVLLLSACGQKEIVNPLNYTVNEFSAITEEGEPFEIKDMEGKIWIADFIFTNCPDVCPPMTANMIKLQKMVEDENLENVEFVSFSVDPTVDTPEKLISYQENYGLKSENWTFLTGYSQEDIEKYAMETFKTIVKKPANTENQVIHQTYFYLVSPDGLIKKIYDGFEDVPYEDIIKDIKTLQ